MIANGDASLSTSRDSHTAKSGTLTKANLIEEVSRVLEIPRKEAAVIVERMLDSTGQGEFVQIQGGAVEEVEKPVVAGRYQR